MRSSALWYLLGLLSLASLSSGCLIGEVPLDNKKCPCSAAYVCDETKNICVRRAPGDDGGAPDQGTLDAAAPDAPAPDAVDQPDAMPGDAMPGDAPEEDAMPEDAMPGDAPAEDAMPEDTGPDAGFMDALLRDTGPRDTGFMDAQPPDTGPVDAAAAGTLALGDDCTYHEECASGRCIAVTSTSASQVCTVPCGSTADCALGFSCQFIQSMSFCLPERIFSPRPHFETVSGGTCTSTSNRCHSGVCDTSANICLEHCSNDLDCAGFGGNCWNSRTQMFFDLCVPQPGRTATGQPCMTYEDCQSGLCHFGTNTCVEHCCSNADCPVGQACLPYSTGASTPVKVCLTVPNNGMNLAYGASCQFSPDCASGFCSFTTPAQVPPRECTTTCCEDSDCAVLPGGGRCWPFPYTLPNSLVGICIP